MAVAIQREYLEIVDLLVRAAANLAMKFSVKKRGGNKRFFDIAVIQGDAAVIERLCKTGKSGINQRNGERFTPVFYVKNPEVLGLLL